MKTRYQLLILIVVIIALSIVSFRGLLFTEGTIGHNWDWSVPVLTEQIQSLFSKSFYTWSEAALGYPKALALPVDMLNMVFYIGSIWGAGGHLVSSLLIMITPLLAGFSMFFLLKGFFRKSSDSITGIAITGGSLLYAFSPFLFNEFIGGAWSQFIAYALMPLPILFMRRAAREEKFLKSFNLLGVILTLSLLSISTHTLLLTILILAAYTIIQKKWLKYLGKGIYVLFGFVLVNLYWIIPAVMELKFTKSFMSGEEFISPGNLTGAAPTILEALTLSGYARTFTEAILGTPFFVFWLALIILFLFGCIFTLLKSPRKESLFWIFVFVASLIFVTAGRAPLGNFVVWAFENVPFMSGFRSIQHFIPASVLAATIVITLGARQILAYIQVSRKDWLIVGKTVLVLVVFLWIIPFWLTGDLGKDKLADAGMSHIDSFELSPGYIKAYKEIDKGSDTGRFTTLPMSFSPVYLDTEYQMFSQGGDPTLNTFKAAPFFADFRFSDAQKKLGEIYEKNMVDLDISPEQNNKILDLLSISNLIYRRDVEPNPTNYSDRRWYNELVNDYLGNSPLIEEFSEDYVTLYSNEGTFPKIYANTQNTFVDGNLDALNSIIELDGLSTDKSLYFVENNEIPYPQEAEFQHEYYYRKYSLKYMKAEKGEGLWEYLQDGRTIEYEIKDSGKSELQYEFSVPVDGVYTLKVKLRHDTDEGIFQAKVDDGDWSNGIHPYFKTSYYTPGRDSWYYRDIKIGDYKLTGGKHYITFRSSAVPDNSLPKYKQGIHSFSVFASKDNSSAYSGNPPQITFEKINPTHYQVEITGAKDPFYLNFLESYNSNWKLIKNGNILPEDKHFIVNGFANSWYLEEEGTYTVDIVYRNQQYFAYAGWFSLGSILILLLVPLGINLFRRKNAK